MSKSDRQDYIFIYGGGNATVIDDTDHGNPKNHESPHAHDLIDGSRSSGRSLTEEEKEVFEECKAYDNLSDEEKEKLFK